MLIGDGVTPANDGRGYVLRRLLRRAIRSMRLLGYEDPALPELLPVARDCMAPSYPELATDFERISTYAYNEEETFRQTLRAGTTILDLAVAEVKQSTVRGQLSGSSAFQLHDTYGFPIDLTLEMAAEQGIEVDEDGFRRLMAEQRARAKADAQAKKTAHLDLSRLPQRAARGPVGQLGAVHRLHRDRPRGAGRVAHRPGRAAGRGRRGRRGRGRARHHTVLRRGRRAAARLGPHHRQRRRPRGRADRRRRAAAAAGPDRAPLHRAVRRGAARATTSWPRSTSSGGRACPAATPPRTCCTRGCAARSATRRRRRAR